MHISRKIDLSIYYYLEDYLPDNITIREGFPTGYGGDPEGELELPTVAVENLGISRLPYELAAVNLPWYSYAIDIYAKTKAQRDDLAAMIAEYLDSTPIPVNDYDEGFPPEVSPTRLGTFVISGEIGNKPIYVFPEITPKLYWRRIIDFRGYYSPL